jgi:polyphosphate kinase 2 (PPK2 family)
VLLHLSKDEQRERLRARLDDPTKRWKYRDEDLHTRARWDEYQVAMAEAVEATGSEHAPWHVVPADRKWYRNWAVATIVVGVLEGLGLRWPEADGPAPDVD